MMGSGGEARCNCVLLLDVVCSRVTCAHTLAHVGSWWHRFNLLGSCDTGRQAKEICRCAECARTALIASITLTTGSQYEHIHTLVLYFFLARSLSLSLSLLFSLPSSPVRHGPHGGSRRLVQMHARTVWITSNALSVEIEYTHLHTVGVWCQRAPMRFPRFCIDRAEHLEM